MAGAGLGEGWFAGGWDAAGDGGERGDAEGAAVAAVTSTLIWVHKYLRGNKTYIKVKTHRKRLENGIDSGYDTSALIWFKVIWLGAKF